MEGGTVATVMALLWVVSSTVLIIGAYYLGIERGKDL